MDNPGLTRCFKQNLSKSSPPFSAAFLPDTTHCPSRFIVLSSAPGTINTRLPNPPRRFPVARFRRRQQSHRRPPLYHLPLKLTSILPCFVYLRLFSVFYLRHRHHRQRSQAAVVVCLSRGRAQVERPQAGEPFSMVSVPASNGDRSELGR